MGWQEIVVLICVLVASIYLVRCYTPFLLPKKFRPQKSGCATACGGCAKSEPANNDFE